ncbi:hypothetical protein JCM3775_003535 [Rhodotorula graminis]
MNNPFAQPQQTEVSSAAHRFPDVLASDPDLQRPPPQQQYQPQPQYQQQQYTGYQQQQPQQQQYLQPQSTGFNPYSNGGGGAPSSPYAAQVPGQPGGQYQSSYGYQPQPQQSYAADLDPYAHLGSLQQQGASSSSSGASGLAQGQGGSLLAVQQTQSHPRQYVSEQRGALMAWDDYAWKQLLSRLDALREAWETRVAGLRAAANSGADPTNVQQLQRRANEQVDGIHAAKMQLGEVQSGWRHSTDAASKARVREALNAGITSLPEYPPPVSPHELGGSFIHQAAKQGIMSQYGQPQQPQMTGYQQPQQTGYGAAGGGGAYGGMQPGYGGQQQQGAGGMYQQGQPTGYGGGAGGYGMQPQQTGYGQQYGQHGGGGYGGQGGYY